MEAVIFILVLAPLLLWAQQHHQKRVSETDRVWEEAAEELEGELVLGDRHWYGRDPRVLYATVDRIQVKVDHYSVRSNNTSTTFTRMVANARGPAGLELQVYRTTALSGIAKALGFQDVATGDRAFDDLFIVKANKPALVDPWLNSTVRKRIAKAEEYEYALKEGKAIATRTGLEASVSNLVDAVRATAAFADGRQRVLKIWKRIADDLEGGEVRKVKRGWLRLEGALKGVVIHMGTRLFEGEHYTYVRAQTVGAMRTCFSLGYAQGLSDQQLPPAQLDCLTGAELRTNDAEGVGRRLDAATLSLLDTLEPDLVDADEKQVTVSALGVVTGSRTLRTMLELATSLAAAEGRGPYR